MAWCCYRFSELSTQDLYQILKLRSDVFVVEQNCAYPDIDNKDIQADVRHLFWREQGEIVAYLRLLPPDLSYPDMVSIGRVVVAPAGRGTGLGRKLIQQGLDECAELWPRNAVKIGAQTYLEDFYQSFGFETVSESYLEDGIPHIDMLKVI